MAHDVFICHASGDKLTADAACSLLEAKGIRCWIAPRDILPGVPYGEAIMRALSEVKVFLVILSSRANASNQVSREVERAVHRGLPILPLRIEDVAPTGSLEYFISESHWLDAITPPLQRHLDQLADVILRLLAGEETAQELPFAPSPRKPVASRLRMGGIGLAALAAAAGVAVLTKPYWQAAKPPPTGPGAASVSVPSAAARRTGPVLTPTAGPVAKDGPKAAPTPAPARPTPVAFKPPAATSGGLPDARSLTPRVPTAGGETSLPACLVSVVAGAEAAASEAHRVEQQALAAARRADAAATREKAAHPDAASAPAGAPGYWSYPDGGTTRYWGETVANVPNGDGVIEYSSGDRHSGQYKNGNPNGVLVYKAKAFEQRGVYVNAEATGPEVTIYPSLQVAGREVKGRFVGLVTVVFSDKSVFKGEAEPGEGTEFLGAIYDRAGKLANAGVFKSYGQFLRPTTDCSR